MNQLSKRELVEVPRPPKRPDDAHKGMVGRLMVVGGCIGERFMVGAPALAANAALRSGAGLVQVVAPREILDAILSVAPCATGRVLKPGADLASLATEYGADVVAVGPGCGDTLQPAQLDGLLKEFSGGIVLDADALNILSGMGEWSAKWPHNVVLTPHPGEMKRLIAGWGLTLDMDKRRECAVRFAEVTGVVVLLKGAGTVVSDGRQYYINQTGNSGMATAGAGDVLTGVIAALLGQRMSAFDAAVLGAYVHGLAGDSAAEDLGRMSLTAMDLIDFLPEAFCDVGYEGMP